MYPRIEYNLLFYNVAVLLTEFNNYNNLNNFYLTCQTQYLSLTGQNKLLKSFRLVQANNVTFLFGYILKSRSILNAPY